MLVHLVLFRPRPDLDAAARQNLANALTAALTQIPSVRRVRVGRRVMHGRGYEQAMRANYSHIAMLEFDDLVALQAYLQHPAHARHRRDHEWRRKSDVTDLHSVCIAATAARGLPAGIASRLPAYFLL